MTEFFAWFTKLENAKIFVLILFFVTFVAIVLYVYTGKKRSTRLESYKNIPLQEDDEVSKINGEGKDQ